MPFEIPQKSPEVETQVGRFKKFADAMLKGCGMTYAIKNTCFDGYGGACAIGALFVGTGQASIRGVGMTEAEHFTTGEMEEAYRMRYGQMLTRDNDSGAFTREQIAARIAAL